MCSITQPSGARCRMCSPPSASTCRSPRPGCELTANAERHLKPPPRWRACSAAIPQALAETLRFADELELLAQRTRIQLSGRADRIGPRAAGRARAADLGRRRNVAIPRACRKGSRELIGHELAIIEQLKYARYFLTVHDIVHFARSTRTSSARGAARRPIRSICYCLGITDVDPDASTRLFERFISRAQRAARHRRRFRA